MADALRDRIAAHLHICDVGTISQCEAEADAILAIVRDFATSDAAVEAAIKAMNDRAIWPRKRDMQAAITAALGGGDG